MSKYRSTGQLAARAATRASVLHGEETSAILAVESLFGGPRRTRSERLFGGLMSPEAGSSHACPLCEELHQGDPRHAVPLGLRVCPQCVADLDIFLLGDGVPTADWMQRLEAIARRSYRECRIAWLTANIRDLEARPAFLHRRRAELERYRSQLHELERQTG